MTINNKNRVLYIDGISKLLPNDALRKGRSSPLEWGKFRSSGDFTGDGIRYQRRRQAVKAVDDGFAVLGVYDELLAYFGFAQIAPLRGFIVNYDYRTPTPQQIGQAIGAPADLVKVAVHVLLDVGLLVWVQRPDFPTMIEKDKTISDIDVIRQADDADDTATSDDPWDFHGKDGGEAKADDAAAERKFTPRAKQRRLNKQADQRADISVRRPDDGRKVAGRRLEDVRQETADVPRSDLQTPTPAAAAHQPLSADGNGKTEERNQAVVVGGVGGIAHGTADTPPTAAMQTTNTPQQPPLAAPGTTDTPHADVTPADARTSGDIADGSADTSDAQADDADDDAAQATAAATTAATAAEPTKPTEADREPGRASGRPYDATQYSEAFAAQVVDVLYPTRDDLVLQGRQKCPPQGPDEFRVRELASIAKSFERALCGLGQAESVRLLEKALKEAHATHRKKSKPGKVRGTVWTYWINQHRLAARRSGPPPG